jgi:four helix bundle protein
MAIRHNFKKLVVWQDAMEFCDQIYKFTETLPSKERFNLAAQLEKCSVSIPSNIAEGSGKRTSAHFSEFLTTSLSSGYEAETQLLICQKKEYGSQVELTKLLVAVQELQKKIFNFRETIEAGR